MEQSTLKYLRILIPGLIILLGLYPVFEYKYSAIFDLKSLDTTYVTFISLLIGGIYYQLNIQRIIISPSLYFIHDNIFKKLVKASGLILTKDQDEKLKKHSIPGRDDAFFMIVFYDVIGKNDSLKRKGKNVMFNGIFWTSTADIFLINLCFYFTYGWFFSEIENFETYRKLFFTFSVLGLFLHIISVLKHIKLSNKQLLAIIGITELAEMVKTKFSSYLDD